MLIACDSPGQLGNRLWAYTAMCAMAIESRQSALIILSKDYYQVLDREALEKAKKHKVYFLSSDRRLARLIHRALRFFTAGNKLRLRGFVRNLFSVKLIAVRTAETDAEIQNRTKRFFLVNSWENRTNNQPFIRQSSVIRAMIQPDALSKQIGESRISQLKDQYRRVVGVHIRRGDYREFQNGKFYFEDPVYLDKMKQVAGLMGNQQVCFALFSNEEISLDNFSGLDVSFSRDNSPTGDMWAMASCDYIMGPLSTFSMWASFWKSVPILFIERDAAIKTMRDFRPIIAQDLQEG